MKIVVFGSEHRVGVWDGDTVVDVNLAAADYLSTKMSRSDALAKAASAAPADLEQFIIAGKEALALAKTAAAHVKGSQNRSLVQPISAVKLQAPWPGRRVFCAGINYAQHVADHLVNMGRPKSCQEIEEETRQFDPSGFTKVAIGVTAPDEDLTYPARSTQLDYEGELAVIIGARGTDIAVDAAKAYIWGITLANDWSDRSAPPSRMALSFNLMKNFNGSLSLGPCILVDDSDPQDIDVTLEVNGTVRQDFNTEQMIYSFAEYIAYLSKDLTLIPGDLLLGGTGAGTAADASKRNPDGTPANLDLFLKVGDVVEIKSPKIGALRNRVVAKA